MRYIKIKIVLVLSLPFAFVTLLKAQNTVDSSAYGKARDQAQSYEENLLLYRDYDYAVAHTYPLIVEENGGEEKMKEALKAGLENFDEYDKQDISYDINVAAGIPAKIIDTAQQLQCIIPDTMTVTIFSDILMGNIVSITPLIGISEDEGNTWYFTYQGNEPHAVRKKSIPTLSSQLHFLPNRKPVFHQSE